MTDETGAAENKSAKKLNYSHLGVAGGVMAAMVMLQPVKDFFYTREEGRASESRIVKVEKSIEDLSAKFDVIRTEIQNSQMSSTDRIMAELRERDSRTEARINSLESNVSRNVELLLKDAIFNKRQLSQGGK